MKCQGMVDRLVIWSASGEADVVFSSRREFRQCFLHAQLESLCLWNVAKKLAFSGRYAEAFIAGSDAINCLSAIIPLDPLYADQLPLRRADLASWVSMKRNPVVRSTTALIKEADEPDNASGSPSSIL